MVHNKCAKGGRIGGRFLGAAVGGGGRTVLHMGLLNKQKISQVKNIKQKISQVKNIKTVCMRSRYGQI